MGTTPKNKAIDAEYLLKQFKALNTKVFEKTYSKIKNATFTGSFSHNRKAGTTIGTSSFAEGDSTTASGDFSHAEGNSTTASGMTSHAEGGSTDIASNYVTGASTTTEIITAWNSNKFSLSKGDYSHTEGLNCLALGNRSHAEGSYTIASGDYSHAEGTYSQSSGNTSHAEGERTKASGEASHAEGYSTTASGNTSHAEGNSTTASGNVSHAEGSSTTASGRFSHAEGNSTTASGDYSHAEGRKTTASGYYSHAEGDTTTASGDYSHAEGFSTTASGTYSHAEGYYTKATNHASHASGKYNAAMTTGGASGNTTGTAFVIGNGTGSSALSNAFSVQYSGIVKAKSTITASTTADYAEFFEWLDKNPNEEDRVGHFVTLDGDKIKIATSEDDYILGIVSGEPFVLGNGDCDTWNGMYLHDEFRRTMYEPAPKMIEILDSEGNPTGEYEEVEGEYEGTRPVLNPDYDQTKQYISRFDRAEWSPVGMLGVLAVLHDGTAEVNGYVTVNNEGIATKCTRDTRNSYRVIKKVSDKVVEVIFR